MEGLRAEAKLRFLRDQKFTDDAALDTTSISLITFAKFGTRTQDGEADIPWANTKSLVTQINSPVKDANNQPATATLRLVKVDRDLDGTLLINRKLFMEIFDDFGFDPYWLHLIQGSVYGLSSLKTQGGALSTFYFHTVLFTLMWSYNHTTKCTKVIVMPRETDRNEHQRSVFGTLLQSMKYQKALIDDWRFCSLVCGIQLVDWMEDSLGANLQRIRLVETVTEHGAWRMEGGVKVLPGVDDLVDRSKQMGVALTMLSNVVRHASIAKTILSDLSSSSQPLPATTSTATGNPTVADDVASAVVLLTNQIDSGELQAGYLQARAETQHSVIFNFLARHDSEASKALAEAAQKDSYSMKTIAIMTMVFLPATFFATLFAMPLLKWDESVVMQPNFKYYWIFSVTTTVIVLLIWDVTSKDGSIFTKCWKAGRRRVQNRAGDADSLKKAYATGTRGVWIGLRSRKRPHSASVTV